MKTTFILANRQTMTAETKEEALRIEQEYFVREMTIEFDDGEKETFTEDCGRDLGIILDELL